MSVLSKEQATKFLAPLRGALTTILVQNIRARVPTSRFLLECARLSSSNTTILDTGAFYSTNISSISTTDSAQGEILLLPEHGFEVSSLIPLLSVERQLLIIDDLTSLFSLASDGLRLQQLTILTRMMSHTARVNGSWVIATAYKAEGVKQDRTNKRSLTAVGDLTLRADSRDGGLRLSSTPKGLWPQDELYFEM